MNRKSSRGQIICHAGSLTTLALRKTGHINVFALCLLLRVIRRCLATLQISPVIPTRTGLPLATQHNTDVLVFFLFFFFFRSCR
ncbi:hypothetical protein GGR50DRAFT_651194 [Xylaria sp. CBS 124048]|nr:hypothetical protein GGR50DRAFT_651194 [Xylaria sp. CBS 124048]